MNTATETPTVIVYRNKKRCINLHEFSPFITLRNLMIRNQQLENKDI